MERDDERLDTRGEDTSEKVFPDPWGDEHDIEYWIWNGTRLVPATPAQVERIQEDERQRQASYRLAQWHNAERRRQRMHGGTRLLELVRDWLAFPMLGIRRPPLQGGASAASRPEHVCAQDATEVREV